ncbi:MAG: cytochrome c biogenesis protein ResB [Chloroflexi bacterium]|nr:cytochrome c biogenesis protein ResB [Chloroflexota bacterium]
MLQRLWIVPGVTRLWRAFWAIVGGSCLFRLLGLWAPRWAVPARRGLSGQTVILPGDLEGAQAVVGRALAAIGSRAVPLHHAPGQWLGVSRRSGPGHWLAGLFYLGVIALLLAGLIREGFGSESAPLRLTLGEARPLAKERKIMLRLEQITVVPAVGARLQRFEGQLAVLHEGEIERIVTVGLSHPAWVRGYSLYLLDYGPAVRVTAQDAGGRRLRIYPLVGTQAPTETFRLAFERGQAEELLAIPEVDLVLRLVHYESLPAQGMAGETVHLQILGGRSRDLLAETFVSGRGQLAAHGVQVTVAPEYYVILQAQREPDVPLAAGGGAFILLGMIAFIVWPPHRVWVALEEGPPGGTRCHIVARAAEIQSPWFRRALAVLEEEAFG